MDGVKPNTVWPFPQEILGVSPLMDDIELIDPPEKWVVNVWSTKEIAKRMMNNEHVYLFMKKDDIFWNHVYNSSTGNHLIHRICVYDCKSGDLITTIDTDKCIFTIRWVVSTTLASYRRVMNSMIDECNKIYKNNNEIESFIRKHKKVLLMRPHIRI